VILKQQNQTKDKHKTGLAERICIITDAHSHALHPVGLHLAQLQTQ
jgi:hypothetical protein